MDMVNSFGKMGGSIKANGLMGNKMEKVARLVLVEMKELTFFINMLL